MAACDEDFPPPPEEVAEEEEEDDVDTEEEPKLKYERIGFDMTAILAKDAASCMAVHPKFLALGTHWGMIHILDHQGNNIRSKEIPAHSTTVNQISIDNNGDYIASCSDDGKVVVKGLYSDDNNYERSFDRPIKAIALDPNFYKSGSGKHIVTGDDKLMLGEKSFLKRYSFSTIHEGEGPIRSIKWRASFIAWSNDRGVKVYDTISKKRITHIARDSSTALRPDLYRCNLAWKDNRTLLIGWGNSVKVCVVKERDHHDMRDLPSRYVEIVYQFNTDFMVCGLAPFSTQLVILSYEQPRPELPPDAANRPNLRICEPQMDFYEEVSNDGLSVRNYMELRSNDYHLESLVEGNDVLYYIVSPKDVVVARQRDHDDHIAWLVEHDRYEEAMAAATKHQKQLKRYTFQEIGMNYLMILLEEEQYDEAAALCVKVLGKDKSAWERQVYTFAQLRRLQALAPFVPLEDPRLDASAYELVLNSYLQSDHAGFQQLIKTWPNHLYNIQTIVNAVLEKIERDPKNNILMQCLGDLYTYDKRYDKALGIYLRLRHPDVFELIHKHDLFDSISDKIELLMAFEPTQATKMLLDNITKVPVDQVVQQLERTPKLLHEYLAALFKLDPHLGRDYHRRQVALYAEYERSGLMMFLRSSNYYPLQAALNECQARSFIPEMVFLLGRMGNTKEALHLITHDQRDVKRAIEFCKEHLDEELWDDLINFSIDKPSFITGLLQNIGTHVDPIRLIREIEPGMEIPGLRDSLVTILHDYNLQMSLLEGCKKILVSDCFHLMQKQSINQKRAMYCDESQTCSTCRERIIVYDTRLMSNVVMFHCHHVFHEDCLPAHAMDSCSICSAKQRGPGSSSTT